MEGNQKSPRFSKDTVSKTESLSSWIVEAAIMVGEERSLSGWTVKSAEENTFIHSAIAFDWCDEFDNVFLGGMLLTFAS